MKYQNLVVFRRHSVRQCPGLCAWPAGGACSCLTVILLLCLAAELPAQACTDAGFLKPYGYAIDSLPAPRFREKPAVPEKAKATLPRLQSFINHYAQAEAFGHAGDSILLRFFAYTNGKVSPVSILHSPDAGSGQEAQRLFHLMQDCFQWPPGMHRGRKTATRQDFLLHLLPDGKVNLSWRNLLIPPPPPPPPPPVITCNEIFVSGPNMPRFPGCERLPRQEREACSREKLMAFLHQRLQYPEEALQEQKEDVAVVRFTVEKDGSIGSVELIRDPGYGMGEEALRLVRLISQNNIRFTSSTSRGRALQYSLTVPVRYKLPGPDTAGRN